MNVSGVSSSSAATATTTSSSRSNSVVNSLQQMKTQLMNQLSKVNESKEDSKSKAEKIKQINQQIQEIDKQIQQAMLEQKQKEIQEAQEKSAEKAAEEKQEQDNENTGGVVMSASLNTLLSVHSRLSDNQKRGSIRNKLKGEMRVAESEIKHSTPGSSIEYKLAVISGNSDKLSDLEHKMGKAAGEIHKGIEKSVKAGIKEAEKVRENKNGKSETEKENVISDGKTNVQEVAQTANSDNQVDVARVQNGQDTEEASTKPAKSIDIVI